MSRNETPSPDHSSIDRRKFIGGSAAAMTLAGLAVAGSRVFAQSSTPTPGAEATPGTPSASPAASPAGDSAAIDVHAVDIAYEPKEFTIPADTDVRVNIINDGALQHDFNIDELDVHSDLLNGGESTTVTINGAAGTYEYYCSVTGHREAGMVGTLTIE